MKVDYSYKRAIEYLKPRIPFRPQMGIILGSGLGGLYQYDPGLKIEAEFDYKDIDGFPESTVAGHDGRLIIASLGDLKLCLMKGRVHYYEGYDMETVLIPIMVMSELGISSLLISNAAGGIAPYLDVGNIMLIEDHISSFVPSPTRGFTPEELKGVRFHDMSSVYDKTLIKLMKEASSIEGIDLKEGVYLQTPGPQYETPAEIRAFRTLGADAVGMSTACEATLANALGIRVAGLSCITNKAAGLGGALSHEEVTDAADKAGDAMKRLVFRFLMLYSEDSL